MNQLRSDWRVIRAKGRRRPAKSAQVDDLHEDWAAVKGGKYPPYAFIVRWSSPAELVIFKMYVIGKSRTRDGVFYRAQYAGIFFKTSGASTLSVRPLHGAEEYARSVLCFTNEEVAKAIEQGRVNVIGDLVHEMRRINSAIGELSGRLRELEKGLDGPRRALDEARRAQIPEHLWKELPKKVSKRRERA